MKLKKLMTVTALALAAASIVSTHASASAGQFDLILGFQASGGTGGNTNLEIDLGPYTNFTTTTSTTTLSQLVGTDLVNTYGSGWASRSDLVWGIAGITSNNGTHTFYSTVNDGAPQVATSLTAPWGNVSSLVSGYNTGTTASASAVTVGDNTTPASTLGTSYTSLVAGDGSGDFSYFGGGETQFDSATAGNPLGSLELYGMYQSGTRPAPNANDIGGFTLSGSGSTATLTFTGINAAAVPEPSSYALGLCGLFLLWVLKRRKSIA